MASATVVNGDDARGQAAKEFEHLENVRLCYMQGSVVHGLLGGNGISKIRMIEKEEIGDADQQLHPPDWSASASPPSVTEPPGIVRPGPVVPGR